MAATSDFDAWLAQIDFWNPGCEDVYDLVYSIRNIGRRGRFNCRSDPVTGGKLVTLETGNELLLATSNAEKAFLSRIMVGQSTD